MVNPVPRKAAIFVDVQNIYYTCRQIFSRNFDYNAFWAQATSARDIVAATAYATDRGDTSQQNFQRILRAIGFEVKLKPMVVRRDGSRKADWDVGIALDVYEQAASVREIILLSGDGDFGILAERIKQRFNTDTVVYGVAELTSASLSAVASRFVKIDDSLLLTKS